MIDGEFGVDAHASDVMKSELRPRFVVKSRIRHEV